MFVLFILFFAGCATFATVSTYITSNKIQAFDGEIHKIFIIVKVEPDIEDFAKYLEKNLPASFEKNNVNAKLVYEFPKKGDSIVYRDIMKKHKIDIDAYRPDAILIIKQNSLGYDEKTFANPRAPGGYSVLTSTVLEFSAFLISTELDKLIWSADARATTEDSTKPDVKGSAWTFKNKLILALEKDDLID